MATQERLLDVDAVTELIRQPDFADKRFYMIDGVIFEMSPVKRIHSSLAYRISKLLGMFVEERDLGEIHIEIGCYPPGDRSTLLAPDVAYVSHARLSQQPKDEFLSVMPGFELELSHLFPNPEPS